MQGFAVRLPRGREMYVELRQEWLGFGSESHGDDREVYLGFFQVTYSRSVALRQMRLGLLAAGAALFIAGAAVPMVNAVEAFDWFTTIIMPLNEAHDDLEEAGIIVPPPFNALLDAADEAVEAHNNQLPE